jgi:tRNA G18 (ribose-2'-O)-methylase SpoU
VLIEVSDPLDPRLEDYFRLTDVALRRRIEPLRGLFMAESAAVIERALAAGIEPFSLLMTPKWTGPLRTLLDRLEPAVPVYVGPDEVLRQLTGFNLHRGVLAAMGRPVLPSIEQVLKDARRAVVLEDIVDHTNVGAIFRAAAGLGVDAALATPCCADPFYRRSVRVSMGSVFSLPWTRFEGWPQSLAAVKAQGWHVAAMSPDPDAIALDRFAARLPDRLLMLVGTEGDGLTSHALELADTVVSIPMSRGVDSLNVASAAAVTFWATRPASGE